MLVCGWSIAGIRKASLLYGTAVTRSLFLSLDDFSQEVIMHTFSITRLVTAREESGQLYHEFLRVPSMSAGLYQLGAGTTDPQQPHTEDELYYIVQGRAQITVDGENIAVEPGSLIFVAANIEHRFHTITEDLTVLVFFAPAESTPGDILV